MDLSRDTYPRPDRTRDNAESLAKLKQAGQNIVLTIEGGPELVIQDAASYRKLLDLAERLDTIQVVKEGLASIDRGEGKAMEAVFEALERQLQAKTKL